MLRTPLRYVAVLGFLQFIALSAWGDSIVNIGGTQSGFTPGTFPITIGQTITPVGTLNQLTLDAGTYTITNGTGKAGADPNFTAWRYNSGANWVWNFAIADDSTKKIIAYGYSAPPSSSGIFSTQELAAAAAATPSNISVFTDNTGVTKNLTLSQTTTLDLMVVDYYLPDNAGGVVLDIAPAGAAAPAPAIAWAALALLGGMGAVRVLRNAHSARGTQLSSL